LRDKLNIMQSFFSTERGGGGLADPAAFERAYREHRPVAYAAALRVLRDPAVAEEVVQDAFTQLWARPGAFDARRGSLRTYVAMLARSRAMDRGRTRVVREAAMERLRAHAAHETGRAPAAADVVLDRERSAEVVSIVDRLPPHQREAVLLAFGRELTAQEIATAVGVPLGTAKSRIRLGLQKLRDAAEEQAA
jgi:RNA polymerase sigma-70 factor (ECF subfamily)